MRNKIRLLHIFLIRMYSRFTGTIVSVFTNDIKQTLLYSKYKSFLSVYKFFGSVCVCSTANQPLCRVKPQIN